jgi:mannose-1-phosphate guanylyltransferase
LNKKGAQIVPPRAPGGSIVGGVIATMILAAGLGTRLRPLTDHCPKPLVPVGDAPVLVHILRGLAGVAKAPVVVNAFHLPDAFADLVGDVHVVTETRLLGTAGGVRNAAPWLGADDVLVWNGDILAELPAEAVVRTHRSGTAQSTLVVRPRPAGQGNVGVDAEGRVVRLRTTAFGALGPEAQGGEFLGIHVLGAAVRARLPAEGCLVGDVYLPMLAEGAELAAFLTEVPFSDIGSVASYRAANATWLAARGLRAYVHPTAVVTGRVDGCVIGARARVHADLADCVVWPDTEVLDPHTGRVLGPKFFA